MVGRGTKKRPYINTTLRRCSGRIMPEHAKAAVTDDAIVNAILIHASSIGASEILHHNVHLREKFTMHTMPKNPAQASSMVICKPVGMAPADMSLLTTLGVTYVLIFPVPCPPRFGGLAVFFYP